MATTTKNSGNFADNPKKASEAGKKGGHASHGGSESSAGKSAATKKAPTKK